VKLTAEQIASIVHAAQTAYIDSINGHWPSWGDLDDNLRENSVRAVRQVIDGKYPVGIATAPRAKVPERIMFAIVGALKGV